MTVMDKMLCLYNRLFKVIFVVWALNSKLCFFFLSSISYVDQLTLEVTFTLSQRFEGLTFIRVCSNGKNNGLKKNVIRINNRL